MVVSNMRHKVSWKACEYSYSKYSACFGGRHTVRAGNLAPDHPDVGAADLTLGPVNESDLLAKVEVGGLGVVNTFNLHQGGVGGERVL